MKRMSYKEKQIDFTFNFTFWDAKLIKGGAIFLRNSK